MRGETRRDTREILAGVRSIAAYEFASCMCTLCASHDTHSRRGQAVRGGDVATWASVTHARSSRLESTTQPPKRVSTCLLHLSSITVHTRRFAWERVSRSGISSTLSTPDQDTASHGRPDGGKARVSPAIDMRYSRYNRTTVGTVSQCVDSSVSRVCLCVKSVYTALHIAIGKSPIYSITINTAVRVLS